MLNKATLYTVTLLGVCVLFNSCKKEYENIQDIDDRKIQEYISRNNLTVTKDPTGFYYQIVEQGTGDPLVNQDSVLFAFDYKSLNGVSYYSTPEYTNDGNYLGYITKEKSQLYPKEAFRIAMAALNHGGKVKVIIPSYLAFGKNGIDVVGLNVPSNEIIVSDISTFTEESQTDLDETRIVDFLNAKGLTATKHSSGVHYIVTEPGTGTIPIDITTTLKVKFTGRLFNGTVFDQTTGDETYDFKVNDVGIQGWRKVLTSFTKGAKVRLFVPSTLGYGSTAQGSLPANSCLDFDIEIVEVTE